MVLIGLGVLAGAIVVLAVGVWVYFLVTFKTYQSAKDGLQMAYPKSWVVKDHPEPNVLVAFIAPNDNALDTFAENVNLSTFDMADAPRSTDDYAKIVVEQMSTFFANVKVVSKIPFLVAGRKGYRLIFTIEKDDPKKLVVYVFTIDKTGYNILYIGSQERYPHDLPLMDLMAVTLKVNP